MSTNTRKREIENEAREFLGLDLVQEPEKPAPEKSNAEKDAEAAEAAFASTGSNQPSYTDLIAHMDRFGPEGIVESAIHLPDEQQEKLAKRAKKMKYNRERRKWE